MRERQATRHKPTQSPRAAPNQAAPAAAGAGAAGAAAAAKPANRWLGPVAGLAAGLGIAALLSHFGIWLLYKSDAGEEEEMACLLGLRML